MAVLGNWTARTFRAVAATGLLVTVVAVAPANAQTAPPAYGPAGCTTVNDITISGGVPTTLFASPPVGPNRSVDLFLDGRRLTTVVADGQGNYSFEFTAPGSISDSSTVRGVCVAAVQASCGASATDDVTARVPGQTEVTLRSTKPFVGGLVGITVNGNQQARVRTDANGNWRYSFTTPGTRSDTFTVSAPCADIRTNIADTGFDSARLSQVGAGVLAFGAVTTLAARRRKVGLTDGDDGVENDAADVTGTAESARD